MGFQGKVVVPGGAPANLPANFETLRDNRLLHNTALTRRPTNDREWSAFIQELNKWVKNEVGSFDVGGSNTAQFIGFSSDPASANVWWARYGQIVHAEFYFTTGTSDSLSFGIQFIPDIITPRDDLSVNCEGMINSGSALTAGQGTCQITSTGIFSFKATPHGGAWTASGNKGFNESGRYSIIYMLRQPGKH